MAELARAKGVSAIAEKMIPKLLGATTLKSFPGASSHVHSMIEAAQPEGIAQALIGMAQRDDSTELLPRINCPTLIVVGDEDTLTPLADAEKMARGILGSRLEIVQGAGHLSNLERPASFNQTVGNFLNQF